MPYSNASIWNATNCKTFCIMQQNNPKFKVRGLCSLCFCTYFFMNNNNDNVTSYNSYFLVWFLSLRNLPLLKKHLLFVHISITLGCGKAHHKKVPQPFILFNYSMPSFSLTPLIAYKLLIYKNNK